MVLDQQLRRGEDELRKGIVSCRLVVEGMRRAAVFAIRLVAEAPHGDDIFVAGLREEVLKIRGAVQGEMGDQGSADRASVW